MTAGWLTLEARVCSSASPLVSSNRDRDLIRLHGHALIAWHVIVYISYFVS